ncbi:hypothetical protein [Paenibacillus sp. Soil724D2]|uniref:hypothetical protein n=1 Tax=Paenibacillus sp. (strain Soil724D2) TaxID=1736392 RepID=UPI0007139A29|nr:hypothetical protein [Paenibacillus sp. Soil724D2]KRE48390.1 hypothetical protein ASG85_05145 [Paenibacillus sp. Soil724D2]
MENTFVITVDILVDPTTKKISEGAFLTVLAKAEKHYKDVLKNYNLRCPRCRIIIGDKFKMGIRSTLDMILDPQLVFFAAHPSCMDDPVSGDLMLNDQGEIEVTASAFLNSEDEVLSYQKGLDRHLNMLEFDKINGEYKVVMRSQKAISNGSMDQLIAAATVRFKEIEDLGVPINCPVCRNAVLSNQERFIAMIPHGSGKDANIEMVHQHCRKRFQKIYRSQVN